MSYAETMVMRKVPRSGGGKHSGLPLLCMIDVDGSNNATQMGASTSTAKGMKDNKRRGPTPNANTDGLESRERKVDEKKERRLFSRVLRKERLGRDIAFNSNRKGSGGFGRKTF